MRKGYVRSPKSFPTRIYLFEHDGNLYVGSTINFKERMWAHNQHMKQEKHNNCEFYKYCNSVGIKDVRPYIHTLQAFSGRLDKETLLHLEADYIDEYCPNLNHIYPVARPRP
tara:strand:+ start:544 stop:879 length:336 start_codon:yes stop_codon:yes gene_type:complete